QLGGGAFHKHRHGVGKLGAALRPVSDAIVGDPEAFFLFGRHRVVEADALNESAIAPIARVRDNNVVERTLLGAAARESDDNHVELSECRSKKTCNYSRNRSTKRIVQRRGFAPQGRGLLEPATRIVAPGV